MIKRTISRDTDNLSFTFLKTVYLKIISSVCKEARSEFNKKSVLLHKERIDLLLRTLRQRDWGRITQVLV